MNFTTAIRESLAKYVTFSGRARRSEFWWFWLFIILVSIATGLIDTWVVARSGNLGWAGLLSSLALFLPSLSVSVRRLHDIGRSGWWWWLGFVPLIGWIVLLVWYCQPSEPGPNRFGPDPFTRPPVAA